MTFDSSKAKGNEYFAKADYEKAVKCYSEALTFQPQNHLALSNRSAAYIKLNLYQKAYDDAVQCIKVAPKFARGYLRKATALNGLEKYTEALLPAEQGYYLRGSDQICKDCVTQWLKASKAMLEKDVAMLQDDIPGVSPLTKKCFEILHEIEKQDKNLTPEILQDHMFKIAEELECILQKFGHSMKPCMGQWIEVLMRVLKEDPRTHAAPPATTELFKQKSAELVLWLDSEVDHLLYPIIRPVFGLLTLSMLTCVSTLNQIVSSRTRIQVITKACLMLYKDSILSSKQYLRLHIHALQHLLNSFCMETGHNRERGQDESNDIKSLTKELKSLLSHYDPSNEDYVDVKKSTDLVIENATFLISSKDQPFKRLTKADAEMLKDQITTEIERLESNIDDLHFRDMDSLVLATGGFTHINEIGCAEMALKKSESFYMGVIIKLLENKLLALNDAAECFFHPQAMMLSNAVFFAGIDDIFLANVHIRWKCLSTELYAILARVGLSDSLLSVFQKIEDFKLDSEGKGNEGKILVEITSQHKKEVDDIVQKWGKKVISLLLDQSWEDVQKMIQPKQMLLQYCMVPLYDTSCYPVPIPPKVTSLTGVVIAIMNDGPPVVKTLDFRKIQDLAVETHNKAMKAVAAKHARRPWRDLQIEADKKASDLLQVMFPRDIQSFISSAAVESVYFCPDQVLAKFPIEILPFRDGKYLGDNVSITYLSSARELLRESTLSLICSDPMVHAPTNKCIIFANPNFDMEKSNLQGGSHWNLLGSLLSSFFTIEDQGTISKAHSLPGSESEAYDIKHLLTSQVDDESSYCVDVAIGDDATLYNALQVNSPLVLHFATHGFSSPDFHYQYHNFWSDTRSGLLLAGANTYRLQKYNSIANNAGTGELTALAACGMKLIGTRLVYLSTCRSSYGFIGRGEALSSLAQGFRIAGSKTVIATLWPVSDEVGHKIALNFYTYAKQGMLPSLALQAAKKKLREEDCYEHWYNWAGFLCIGMDVPIFI